MKKINNWKRNLVNPVEGFSLDDIQNCDRIKELEHYALTLEITIESYNEVLLEKDASLLFLVEKDADVININQATKIQCYLFSKCIKRIQYLLVEKSEERFNRLVSENESIKSNTILKKRALIGIKKDAKIQITKINRRANEKRVGLWGLVLNAGTKNALLRCKQPLRQRIEIIDQILRERDSNS